MHPLLFPWHRPDYCTWYTLQVRTIVINLEPIKAKESVFTKKFVRMRGEQLRGYFEGPYA